MTHASGAASPALTPSLSLADERGRGRAPASAWAALVLGALPGAGLATAAALGWLRADVALLLFVPSFVALNAMHMAATWSRTYLTRDFASERPIERIVVPTALVVAALFLEALGGAIALFGLQYYLSLHHAAMQNYGLLRATQRGPRPVPGALASRTAQAACVLPLMAALAYRAREICGTYDEAPLATPPATLVAALAAGAVVATIAFALQELAARSRGEAIDPLGVAIVLGLTWLWVALIVLVAHPALPLFAIASGHYVQYLWVAGRAERARSSGLDRVPSVLREWIHPGRSTAGHLAFLAALGASGIAILTLVAIAVRGIADATGLRPAAAMELPPWGAAMLAVNLHHYWLDHRIWRSAPARAPTPS